MKARRRIFTSTVVQEAYDRAYVVGRLWDPNSGNGSRWRKGYLFPDRPSPYVKNSIAYAYWAAGVDHAREDASA